MRNEFNTKAETIRKYRLTLNLQTFAEGDSEPEPTPEPKTVTMTQDELDALIGREKAKAKKPYADYDELKTKLSDYETAEAERQRAAMTEQERLQAELDAARTKAEEAEGKTAAAITSANKRLIKAEFRALAKESGVRTEALDDAFKLADLSTVKVTEEGDVEGVTGVIKALIESKPYLAESSKPTPRQIGGPTGGDPKPDKTKEQRLAEAADKARKSGKIEDKVAYATLKAELNK
ncbi:scaffolding protein [Paenibacillus sp. NPDC057967]|uniref:phage scaffolding protein n=1 Tax=Paenibacillus sp. NPDC057967 TaxID=3346293 RepID=UPI0036D87F8D